MGNSAERLHNRRSDRDVRHEVSIHHIHMNPICPRSLGLRNLLTQTCEVCGKNRRSEFDDTVMHVASVLSSSRSQ
jgi:hypothetical protein